MHDFSIPQRVINFADCLLKSRYNRLQVRMRPGKTFKLLYRLLHRLALTTKAISQVSKSDGILLLMLSFRLFKKWLESLSLNVL